ncbi:hypothetical protein DPMN_072075 [Dreissena polymorpha]|uniref:Uncharacterized protein n=1 Tax=Dreissena polymorpha TaxID=45954 RepID=A0A9D3Z850_DREPO|nr:hypothetical protein DPMN_072075 [Dreissena polymorpha]
MLRNRPKMNIYVDGQDFDVSMSLMDACLSSPISDVNKQLFPCVCRLHNLCLERSSDKGFGLRRDGNGSN